MAIPDTVSAVNCVPVCDTMRSLSEPQFLLLLIDLLLTQTGIELPDITSLDLQTAVEEGICDLQDRTSFYNASPETMRAIALYLASELA